MRLRSWKGGLEFAHVDDRHEADEKQEQGEEDAERAGRREDIDDRWVELTPGGGKEVAGKRRGHDDEALEPHADVG